MGSTAKSAGKWSRLRKTGLIYYTMASFGLVCSVNSPSIPEMCKRMDITTEDISKVFSAMSLFAMALAIMTGITIDRFLKHGQFLLSLAMFLMSIATVLIPFSSSLWFYWPLTLLQSLGFILCDQSCNVLLLSIWGESSNAPVTGLHAMWGVGFTIGPLIIRPFLEQEQSIVNIAERFNGHHNYSQLNQMDMGNASFLINSSLPNSNMTEFSTTTVRQSRIEIAFAIISSLSLLSSIILLTSYLIEGTSDSNTVTKKNPGKDFKDIFLCKSCQGKDKAFKIFILFSFAIFYFWNAGKEGVFSGWIFTYAVKGDLQMSQPDAALLDFAVKFSFLIGRITAALVALKLSVQIMLFIEIQISLAIGICLAVFGAQGGAYLWVFSCLFNFFSAPVWPAGISWTNCYVEVTGSAFILLNIGAGSSGLLFQWLTGWLFTNRSPDDFFYVIVLCAAVMGVQIIVMQIVASKHGGRYGLVKDDVTISGDSIAEDKQKLIGGDSSSEEDVDDHIM